MKYILIIGDGMADNPVAELGGRTPLEAASIPIMDALASAGIVGFAKNCPEGLPAGSDTAILSIFGCDPRDCYTGRAPLEAAAQGVSLRDGDLAFRCNMASIETGDMPFGERKMLSHSSGGIDGELSKELVEDLFREPEFVRLAEAAGVRVYPTLSYRHIAVQSAGDGRGLVLCPPHDHLGVMLKNILPKGNENAGTMQALMEKSFELLSKHPINLERVRNGLLPANCVWFWAEGTAVELSSFYEHYGKRGAVISAVPLCHGIAALIGLERIYVEGATGELDTNYEGKAAAAAAALASGLDFVGIHVEAPDECTHNGDLAGKLQAIENIDSRVVAPLLKELNASGEDYRLLIISDHRTLMENGAHGAEPVPFILYDSRRNRGGTERYSELFGETGPFVPEGTELMSLLFEDKTIESY